MDLRTASTRLVWALTGLMIEREPQPNIRFPLYRR
jgi:hypothetical protein